MLTIRGSCFETEVESVDPFSRELWHIQIIISSYLEQICSLVKFIAVIINCLIEIAQFK